MSVTKQSLFMEEIYEWSMEGLHISNADKLGGNDCNVNVTVRITNEPEINVSSLLLNWNKCDEEDEEDKRWRLYRGIPVEPKETMEAYYANLRQITMNKWNGTNISAIEFIPKPTKKSVTFLSDIVSNVFDTFGADEYDRKYKDETTISHNLGISESGPMYSGGYIVAPLRRSKTCSVLSVLGFEESPI
jgi:hypothetical protein